MKKTISFEIQTSKDEKKCSKKCKFLEKKCFNFNDEIYVCNMFNWYTGNVSILKRSEKCIEKDNNRWRLNIH